MEGYMWLILISMLAVGILFGFVIGRSKGDVSAPKVRELETNLRQATEEMQSYRAQVTEHFEKTATLFNQLTNDYRAVYEHLANSSNQLCGEQTTQLKSLTADKPALEATGEKVTTAPEAATVSPPAAEKKPEPAEAATPTPTPLAAGAPEAEAPEEKKADRSAKEASVATAAKPSSDEVPRTIH